ncbi:spartin isoform X1 [Ahaetulla prasina]|uniref:spartin isoform X1 n=1 Tax=Ahaetulla prasina TaxID=499056 RepID=UPI0026498D85|nr:spartin isoform X1 [Ahaetulla prasina]XP_058041828.1 spartin isoform X1 [Ahaetulla prasina]XP_058041829.1 spartin isoform X1 [Ahaetulla prasina]
MDPGQDSAMQENENARAIEDEYKKAFVFINKALNADELGQIEAAKNYYRQGLTHLSKGVCIPSEGLEGTKSHAIPVKQMQQKMRETLVNVTARLRLLDENSQANITTISSNIEMPKLYPTIPSKEKPERPLVPSSLTSPPQPLSSHGNIGSTSQGQLAAVSPSTSMPNEAPPAYTPEATDGHYTVSYGTESGEFSSVGDDYYRKCTQPPPVDNFGVDADELILIPHGVQIFYVTPDGQVSAPSYPGYLRIVKFLDTDVATAHNRPPAFLQVCDWIYPLMCNQSPVLSCRTGVYMFPDMMSQVSGSYVGVVLSSELPIADRELFEDLLKQMTDLRIQAPRSREGVGFPSECQRSYKELFEDMLKQISDLGTKPAEASSDVINLGQTVRIQPVPEERDHELPDWSEKIAHGILSGASWLSWGLVKGAEYTGKAIHKGASKLREHIHPEEKPLEVNPTVAKGLHVARQATGGAVKVSQFLVEGVCSVASCVGRELAPHVKKHGSKLVPESLKKDKDGKSTLDGALVVAASGVQGFSTIWQGLECAAKCIAKSVSTETVQTVKFKYGDDAGQATNNAVSSAINVGVTAFNIDHIGIKAMVKKTAKETGHAVLDDYKITGKDENKALQKREKKDEQ